MGTSSYLSPARAHESSRIRTYLADCVAGTPLSSLSSMRSRTSLNGSNGSLTSPSSIGSSPASTSPSSISKTCVRFCMNACVTKMCVCVCVCVCICIYINIYMRAHNDACFIEYKLDVPLILVLFTHVCVLCMHVYIYISTFTHTSVRTHMRAPATSRNLDQRSHTCIRIQTHTYTPYVPTRAGMSRISTPRALPTSLASILSPRSGSKARTSSGSALDSPRAVDSPRASSYR